MNEISVTRKLSLFLLFLIIPIVIFGCIGIGDWKVQMPKIVVSGHLYDSASQPVNNARVRIIIPNAYFDQELAGALYRNETPRDYWIQDISDITTDLNGFFECTLPGHMRSVGGPVFYGSRLIFGKGDNLLVLIKTARHPEVYEILKGRGRTDILSWDPQVQDLASLKHQKEAIRARVNRSKDQDTLYVELYNQ